MDPPSTPSRPRQSAHGPPRRESTTAARLTRSRAALQNAMSIAPSSSLSPPPPEPAQQQGSASHHNTNLTVPAETQSNNNISQIDQITAVTLDGEQAPTLDAGTSANTPRKRKTPAEDEDDPNDARGAPPQKLCPVCRTPIPNLQFTLPPPTVPERPPPLARRSLEPRTVNGGIRLPTAGEDMIDPNREQEVIDVDMDVDMEEPPRPEPRWDPARSGVVGLEILTLGVDEVV
ncbi:hypothetical protein FRC11_009247 [Ceratobasidium sp. 423]|nr:hypothetical protein FRC11_009247 [Ceratobasidium sp. 423]